MEQQENKPRPGRGGWRGGGRPKTDNHCALSVRITPEAAAMLAELTAANGGGHTNKSAYFDELIRAEYAKYKQ